MRADGDLQSLYRYDVELPARHRAGFGEIYYARDLLFGQQVALKTIRVEHLLGEHAPVTLRSFRTEAIAQARFGTECPHIVRVFDIGTVGESLFYTMEILEGGNIGDLSGAVTLATAREIVRQISEAILFAHTRGVVHSDVKPGNILSDRNRQVFKLSDFGLLKVLESAAISRGSGSLLIGGTEYYLPPMHRRQPDRINYATDVYSLALTFHTLVSGHILNRDDRDRPIIPSIIQIRHQLRPSPDEVRQLLVEFVESWNDSKTIVQFREMLERIPV